MTRRGVSLLLAIGLLAFASQGATAPLGPEERRTTDPEIFLGNLDSRIEATERVLAKRASAELQVALAEDLDLRGRIVGRVEDLDRALALTGEAIERSPGNVPAIRLRVRLLTWFHRFDEARELLAGTPEFPGRAEDIGAVDEAVGRRVAPLGETPGGENFLARVEHAHRLADRGRVAEAHGQLEAAQQAYRGVSPYPLAWVQTQRGILYLEQGNLASAQRYFEAAHQRLPRYYLATEHLAEVLFERGELERARSLYLVVVAQTGLPEFTYQLARVERALGNESAAEERMAEAAQGYQALLERYPAAFADHAARFYLETGRTERALALATANLEQRKSIDAWLLLTEVALEAGDTQQACAAIRGAMRTGLEPPRLAALAARLGACERQDGG